MSDPHLNTAHWMDFSCSPLLLQLETVLYASMRFQQRLDDGSRAGFFLGDVSVW